MNAVDIELLFGKDISIRMFDDNTSNLLAVGNI